MNVTFFIFMGSLKYKQVQQKYKPWLIVIAEIIITKKVVKMITK